MEETDLSQFSEAEIMSMYSDVIESGEQVLIAKCMEGTTCINNHCCRHMNSGWACSAAIGC